MMIFFDIGDTLVDESDFARFRHASVFMFLAQRGIATSEEQYTADLNNLSMRGRMTLFEQLRWFALRGGGTPLQAMEVFRDYILHVAPEAPSRFTLFPDARECLERLSLFARRLWRSVPARRHRESAHVDSSQYERLGHHRTTSSQTRW